MKWFQQFGHKWPMSLHDSRQKICGFELKRHQRKNYDPFGAVFPSQNK